MAHVPESMSEMRYNTNYPLHGYNSPVEVRTMASFNEACTAVDHRKNDERVSPELRPLLRRGYGDVLAVLRPCLNTSTAKGEQMQTAGRLICSSASRRAGSETGPNKTFPTPSTTCLHSWVGLCTTRCEHRGSLRTFDCLPEQLLDRVRRLQLPSPVNK